MATGFTGKLVEEGQPFNEFVMTCARAFGPMIEMRDMPLDAPIPESFDGGSSYHKDGLREVQEELKRLQRMSNEERQAYGEAQKQHSVAAFEESIDKVSAQHQRVLDMKQQVSEWNPPEAYIDLKVFMLSQLGMSDSDPEFLVKLLNDTVARLPMDFWDAAVEYAMREIDYHKRGLADSKKNAEKSIEWVRGLQKVLKY